MTKRADEIWSEVPGLPKLMLIGGIFLLVVVSVMNWLSWSWWSGFVNTLSTLGNSMLMPGTILCAAALVAGGLAAGKKE